MGLFSKILPTALSVGAGFVKKGSPWGGVISGIGSALGAYQQQSYDARMQNTAYQRQMADMYQAGLNPMLAMNSAKGAESPQSLNIADTAGTARERAAKAKQEEELLTANIDEIKSRINLNSAQANQLQADTDLKRAQTVTESGKLKYYESTANLNDKQREQLIYHINHIMPEIGNELRARIGVQRAQEIWYGRDSDYKMGMLQVAIGNLGVAQQLANNNSALTAAQIQKIVTEIENIEVVSKLNQLDYNFYSNLGLGPHSAGTLNGAWSNLNGSVNAVGGLFKPFRFGGGNTYNYFGG